jgi:solute carrier family 8 (sodium/calcium exchanger)
MLGPVVDEYDQIDDVTCWEALVHLCTMPWRFVFSIIPPKRFGGGWPTFFVCFFCIGLLSFFIMEVATVIGCLLNIKTCIQALVFISVGTSLPDLFTTFEAARSAKVAGPALSILAASNAANIFVGLGLPWTIASIYQYRLNGDNLFLGQFEVADMAFSTVLFVIFSMLTFLIFGCRRICVHGEIGGSNFCKAVSACLLFLIWIIFVGLVGMNCYEMLPDREIFVPAFAVMATQIAGCPADFTYIETEETPKGIILTWEYPDSSPASYKACEI